MRQLVYHGNGGEVEHVARRRVEPADAALAQDHVVVSLRQHVFRREEQLFDGRRHAAFQEHGLLGPARRLEQRRVLHVAGADLDDVRDFGHVTNAFGIHRLGADEEAGLLARLGEQLEPRPPQPLERVGRGARLPGTAAQDHGPRLLHHTGGLDDLSLALDRAGARDGDDLRTAYGDAPGQPHHAVLRLPLAADLLVRLGDVDDVLDAGQAFQPRGIDPPVVADQADGRALRPRHGPGLVAHLLDYRDDAPDLVFRCAMAHHDQHRYLPPMVNRSPSRAAVTRPGTRVPAARAGSEVSTGG